MANSKKQIILNEILFWKQNKLLPDQYCDFLMTLYTEGNNVELQEETSHKKSVKAIEKRNTVLFFTFISIVSIGLLAALFMVSEIAWLIAAVVVVIAIVLMILAYRFTKKKKLLAPGLYIMSALLFFGATVKICIEYFPENQIVLFVLLVINCILWLFTGFKMKLVYFTVSGAVGLTVLIGYQIFILQKYL